MTEHPGAEFLDAFGRAEVERLAAVEELRRERGDEWWRTPEQPVPDAPRQLGGRRVCEADHLQRGLHAVRCVVKVGEPGRRERECGLPVDVEPAVLRCGCGRGLFVAGWCSSCGSRQPSSAGPSRESAGVGVTNGGPAHWEASGEVGVTDGRSCACCGAGFERARSSMRYCSGRCRMRAQRGRCSSKVDA